MRNSLPISNQIFWPRGLGRSRRIFEILYHFYPKPTATRLGKVLTYIINFNSLSHTPLWRCGHVRTSDQKKIISTLAIRMATEHGIVVTYYLELSSTKSHDPLTTWFSDFLIQFRGLERKHLSCTRLLNSFCVCM